ncbi:ABC transporter ATP-binding protein [Desulfosporosinus sp. BICA1-9]|uniref:ABC transporter ATP-binding protein n=1 Tax=Desulfosporosinus sp. BICA1-9 TaxID=1531958 RepID=UPI00054C5C55|nr:ATP-binding cassette domain-containing protein [Desulfosporosinus sp. BICA1-9]KJS48864.1 MAG: ABC transporter ATP-binding protein [Peptococcaceae bacterium BRH_c23]KJS85786.1 MAG: ABC transporter ATP-binding protein [Desulfosporosinus sp. BICA1-9]HBW34271.1 ABC transporter ATP-binding protein [Desulfosporosinus sp.]
MLELQSVSLEIEGSKGFEILKNINLKFYEKKIYVVTGPNGGGKSSLAKLIMGVYNPTKGTILLDGQDITTTSITDRARMGIGYAFQNPPRFKGVTVKELLNMAASQNPEKINICDLLYDVGLCAQDYLNRDVDSSLSGGEMKRIEIATVLARNLKIAVFDEPEAGIDLWSFQKLAETFTNIHEKYDTTIIIISHQERIMGLADEIIIMSNGAISAQSERDIILAGILNADCACSTNCVKGVGQSVECVR